MRYIMLVYETAADLDSRDDPTGDPYVAAWRAYHKALVEANVYVGGAPGGAGPDLARAAPAEMGLIVP